MTHGRFVELTLTSLLDILIPTHIGHEYQLLLIPQLQEVVITILSAEPDLFLDGSLADAIRHIAQQAIGATYRVTVSIPDTEPRLYYHAAAL